MTLMIRKYSWRERLQFARRGEWLTAWRGWKLYDKIPGWKACGVDPAGDPPIRGQILYSGTLEVLMTKEN